MDRHSANETSHEQAAEKTRPYRLAYFVSHPIQYQAPMLRCLAQSPDFDLSVFYFSDFSLRAYKDSGFGVDVAWDIPLLDGYKSEFLPEIPFLRRKSEVPRQQLCYGIYSRLRAGRFDAVWIHGYHTANALHVMIAARLLGIPVLLRTDSWLADRPRTGMRRLLKQAFFTALKQLVRATLSSGTLNDEYWQHYFGKDFPRFLLPYSVDNDFFEQRAAAAAPQQAALRKELGIESNRPVILFASKLQKRKHCMDLVEAFLQMREDVQPQPYLLIIGDGEERAAIEARIAEAGDAGRKNIFMLGFRNQSELPSYFDLCRVFVLPARHEPWGLIVNEVMNAGRAVIVTDEVGAAPDLVENNVNGFVVPVRDVKALAKALRDVLSNPETAVQMGAKSLERIRHWGFAENVAGMKAALDWLRSGHRSATP